MDEDLEYAAACDQMNAMALSDICAEQDERIAELSEDLSEMRLLLEDAMPAGDTMSYEEWCRRADKVLNK